MLSSVRILLSSIVDYAGLFPPAQLNLETAIDTYNQARFSPEYWMLGHFVLPASRLFDFKQLASENHSISLIVSKQWKDELEQIPLNQIAALEFPPLLPHEIEVAIATLPNQIDAFFEIPFNLDLKNYLPLFNASNLGLKIRTGGITSKLFPNVEQVSKFILTLAQNQICFKATAGLHHPLPGQFPLTYEANSDFAPMHGFLNIAICSALAYHQKLSELEALEILQTQTFQFTDESIRWRDRTLNLAEIEKARQLFFRSFGSCSFHEPVTDLKTLALL